VINVVAPGLLIVTGICAYAAVVHIATALMSNADQRRHLWFGAACVAASLFAISQNWLYAADTQEQLLTRLRWNIDAALLLFPLIMWSLVSYTNKRPYRIPEIFTGVFAVLLLANLFLPFTLQYSSMPEIRRVDLIWGETITVPDGTVSVEFVIGITALFLLLGFLVWALLTTYRKSKKWEDLILVLATLVLLASTLEGILVRFGVLHTAGLGLLGYLAMVIAMSAVLTIETNERVRRMSGENRALNQQLLRNIEVERRYLARELHDELGQSLTAVRTNAVYIANETHASLPHIHERASEINELSGQLYDSARAIMKRLRPAVLDELGLVDAVEDLVGEWRRKYSSMHYRLELEGDLDDLGEDLNIAIFRILQECLTNSLRHSAASRVTIRVAREITPSGRPGYPPSRVRVWVQDNGVGIPPATGRGSKTGFGLRGMRERAEGLSGTFELRSMPAGGVTIQITLPVGGDPSRAARQVR
jgi:signal transduction histidine kinase